MNRFIKKQPKDLEVVDFGIGAMVPATMRHIDCFVTDYGVANYEVLNEYFPEIFTKEGKPKKKMRMYVAEDED
ncbi:MAG: hypothetical protein KBT06_03635 [Prevotellaceae bacterium]|nr:hypothetical protein [Candidatus Colivivens equi]